MGRRNLSEFSRSELVLKRKPIVEAMARARQAETGGDRKSETALLGQESLRHNYDEAVSGKNDRRTDDQLAKEAKTSRGTIRKTEKVLANAIEALVAIREESLYRGGYGTFADYCQQRWQLPPSQAVAMAKVIGPIQQEAAAKRQALAGPKSGRGAKPTGSEKFSEPVGRSADKVAEAVGMSAPTLAKAKAVVDAAAAHPDAYGDLAAEMDATGKVEPAYRKLWELANQPGAPKVSLPYAVAQRQKGGAGGGEGDPRSANGSQRLRPSLRFRHSSITF